MNKGFVMALAHGKGHRKTKENKTIER